ncbi:MAG TPA: SDR family oxidoreductase [Kofleriaceae bacterium]|jgi:NAD(P)-dependent dehydrogenase (short-subunit alcohol dehydrogenase family)
MKNPLDLTGRTILVTGASSGIGQACAVLCAELGAKVILAARDAERLTNTRALLAGDGHAIEPIDLSLPAAVTKWTSGVIARHGALSGLVHCAAIQRTVPLRVASQKLMDDHWNTNVVSALMMLKALQLPRAAAPGCSVVLMSSSAAVVAAPGNAVYSATKGAISALTRSIAIELLPLKIRVNCIEAAHVDTPMIARERENLTPEMFALQLSRHPMGMGTPEDIANAAAFLLADTARWITGSALTVDGGYTAL